jgi:hypothetical protein
MKLVSKATSLAKGLILGSILLLAPGAFAAAKSYLTLNHSMTIGGVTLAPGDYKLQWEGSGPEVELSILQNGRVLLQTPARLTSLDGPAADTAAVTRVGDNGDRVLIGVRFKGHALGMDFYETNSRGQSVALANAK